MCNTDNVKQDICWQACSLSLLLCSFSAMGQCSVYFTSWFTGLEEYQTKVAAINMHIVQ